MHILNAYSRWTVLSALRQGSPIRSRQHIYPLLSDTKFSQLINLNLGHIEEKEFQQWHRNTAETLMQQEPRLAQQAGWATKMINIYLKTLVYVGDGGRPGLRALLHPPIDGGLWHGVRDRFSGRTDILERTHCVNAIVRITTYQTYETIISGLCMVAAELHCSLFEVEQLWGTADL